jgi:hypothetical protein
MAGHGLCDSLAQQVVTTTEGVDAQSGEAPLCCLYA